MQHYTYVKNELIRWELILWELISKEDTFWARACQYMHMKKAVMYAKSIAWIGHANKNLHSHLAIRNFGCPSDI